MILKIVKHEWRCLFSERSFFIFALVFAVVIGYAVQNGASWVSERTQQSRVLAAEQSKALEDKKQKVISGFKGSAAPGNFEPDPADPYPIGMSLQQVSLPLGKTAAISIGQADVLPIDAGVTISTLQRTIAEKDGFENPLSYLAGRFDLSFVIVYLLPLFVLALSFNVISGERENGTLQILMAQPMQLRRLLTGKLAANFFLVTAIFGVVAAAALAVNGIFTESSALPKLALAFVAVASYIAFWFALSLLINSFGYSSATNAIAAAAVWLVIVLVLPSLLNVAIGAIYPVPARSEIIGAVRNVNLDMRKDGSRLLSEHYQDHPELMPKGEKPDLSDFGLAFVYIQREQKKRVSEVEERFDQQLANQQSLVRMIRFLSPSVTAQEALNDIAGTGLDRYADFKTQVKDFDKSWADFFVPRIFRLEKLSAGDFDSIPRFEYRDEPLAGVAARVLTGVASLIATAALLFALAALKLRNYEIGA